jgi:uncharacterized protein
LTGLQLRNGSLCGIEIEQKLPDGRMVSHELPARQLVLAIGHSARTTMTWLVRQPILIEPKPFSLGVRIEHLQADIDHSQYGTLAGHPQLPPAEYKLACHLPSGRSVLYLLHVPGRSGYRRRF